VRTVTPIAGVSGNGSGGERNPPPPSYASALARELRRTVRGDVDFGPGARALYAYDASLYRQVPIGVVVRGSAVTFRAMSRPRPFCYGPDTFTNYFEPAVGIAATEVLEATGFRVVLPDRHVCCGRPIDYQAMPAESGSRYMRNVPGHTSPAYRPPVRTPTRQDLDAAVTLLQGKTKVAARPGQRGASRIAAVPPDHASPAAHERGARPWALTTTAFGA
jgi:hypothetical protein